MNDELMNIMKENIGEGLERIIISNPRSKEGCAKVMIRPVVIKRDLMFQEARYEGKQVFHNNLLGEETVQLVYRYIMEDFKRGLIETKEHKIDIMVSKKGKITIKKNKKEEGEAREQDFSHNRTKQYILKEGIPVPFLIDLGIQTRSGQIVKAKYDKFRQINRFLELIRDVLPTLLNKDEIRIIDFGCGKSYLTFAMYYYFHELLKLNVMMVGLDLKEDVIYNCNLLAQEYGYDKLHFIQGDIADYQVKERADMVVSLHACDTATDYALHKALNWGAEVILAVPCCQHEVNMKLKHTRCHSVLKYGLIKERMSALLTDAVRANLLEELGYEVQIIEFIDMEHTPKNIMIRAIKTDKSSIKQNNIKMRNSWTPEYRDIKEVTDYLQIETTLQKLLQQWAEKQD